MLNESNLHSYQKYAIQHVIEHKYSGLLIEMGLGKSVISLTAINTLMFDYCEISKVLVIAPKRVAEEVWTTEVQKWRSFKTFEDFKSSWY
jgi:superfamily II DNA or RNA helicase